MGSLIEIITRPEFLVAALVLVGGTVIVLAVALKKPASAAFTVRAGRIRASTQRPTVRFTDIAGVDEAVTELTEVKDYLAEPERFHAVGARPPHGILLYGPPGTGKTMLAQALAGEAGVPFYSMSAAAFVEVFVGVGAARVRRLFEQAKKNAPSVVFIDELDAVGRSRSPAAVAGQQEWDTTLNQLLVEMDGFETRSGVLVLAATNRPDVLDAALLRPGRFDRRIALDLPDLAGREAILRSHARTRALSPTVDLRDVARRTAGLSGADLANVLNEAALVAARERRSLIASSDFSEAVERVIAGPVRRGRLLPRDDLERIAHHEAGHAVVAAALPAVAPVAKVSIVARGRAGGFSWFVPATEHVLDTRTQLLQQIAALLAGKAAEEIVFCEPSSGASDDMARAVELARRMVVELGMSSDLGPLAVGRAGDFGSRPAGPNYSEHLAARIDGEVEAILEHAQARAAGILRANRTLVDALATELLRVETLQGEALESMLSRIAAPSGSAPCAESLDGSSKNTQVAFLPDGLAVS